MTTLSVRIPDEIHDRLAKTAKARHMSVNAAMTQAAEEWVAAQVREQLVHDAMDKVFTEDADLFQRLADA